MTPASVPIVLGREHAYCTTCLIRSIKAAFGSGTFPLKCCGDCAKGCTPIPLSHIKRLIPVQVLLQLLKAAFHAHVEQNPDELVPCRIMCCPTVYSLDAAATDDDQLTVTCLSCFSTACAGRGRKPHQGVFCEAASLSAIPLGTTSTITAIWNDSLRCDAPILRSGGCSHIYCRC